MALEQILERTRADLAARKGRVSAETLRQGLSPSDRSLEEALRRPRTGFILECKKASPSRGLLREDFDPAALATSYGWGADGISVLTDAPFFQGSHAYLQAVREVVPLPVLCKDFVVDPYQVVEARAHGADAVLLMLSVVDDETYRACHAVADELSLDVLTEVHDAAELKRAVALDARIVGVNNRDLSTLKVDLATTEALAPKVPGDRVVVCESGVFTHADVLRLRGLADAFLVGTSLVRRDDVDEAVRELVTGRFKVCGLTRPEDAAAAWQAGATWGGLIFAPESPRAVDLATAHDVQAGAPRLRWAGVFVNESPGRVAEVAEELGLSAVQLHGEETAGEVALTGEGVSDLGCEVWKAVRVQGRVPDVDDTGADRLLLDAFRPGQRGGTGQRFDWSLLEGWSAAELERIIISGGLDPEVAAEADRVGAWALDVNSGVEESPGVKSEERLNAFAAALRGRGREAR